MGAGGKSDKDWLMYVKGNLKENESEAPETKSSVCIFGIAPPLLMLKPEAYVPLVSSIGPYHHRRLQQYEETETYKLKMARALERKVPGRLEELVKHIQELDGRIRACYHKYIPYSKEVLSWMLALDTYFILQFLESIYKPYTNNPGNAQNETSPMRSDPILDSIRNTPLWYAIRSDILMLENQVPMFLLKEAVYFTTTDTREAKYKHSETQVGSQNKSEICQGDAGCKEITEHLATRLQAACVHFNPFVRPENYSLPQLDLTQLDLNNRRHVLDFLYHVVAPETGRNTNTQEKPKKRYSIRSPRVFIENAVDRFIRWMISTSAAGKFPSATVLSEVGIKFAPYDSGDLREISFKRNTRTFSLPKIIINDSTEVLLRNLVAWELYSKTSEKPRTRYTYLMDRLIDTERDVAVLKRCGVLNSHMGSDAEVAHMWNSE
ncbi:hypothetical protein SUGI_0844720 [Cryptomeria japonica]|nr:hypothetical protein SUGI_0844720 [Cryptomeria japonica]